MTAPRVIEFVRVATGAGHRQWAKLAIPLLPESATVFFGFVGFGPDVRQKRSEKYVKFYGILWNSAIPTTVCLNPVKPKKPMVFYRGWSLGDG